MSPSVGKEPDDLTEFIEHMSREITVEELNRIILPVQQALQPGETPQSQEALQRQETETPQNKLLIDIRTPDACQRGTIPGAVNIPVVKRAEDDLPDITPITEYLQKEAAGKGTQVFLLCHTGDISLDVADLLCEAGYDAKSVKGGYRTWLVMSLRAIVPPSEEQDQIAPSEEPGQIRAAGNPGRIPPRQMQIERSLIKKFRKELWCRFTKAVRDYQLISEGDKIAVCISGGKDSMVMAKLMQEIQRHGTMKFDLVFLCMNPGYNEENWELIQSNARIMGIPLRTFQTDIFDAVANVDHHPCYLCARMRRGYLYNHAKQLGCNKIALGHHYDDVIETILMGILYAGKTETMMPKLHSQNFSGMELIRPLYLIREEDIKAWCRYNDLHFIQCACRFTETCSIEGGNTGSKRALVKQLIQQLSTEDAYIEQNIFNCVRDINLRTVIGYHKDGEYYNFLDDYEKYRTER